MSIQDLRPNPQDNSTFYLEKIFQLLADPNVTRASISSTVVKAPPFSPPKYAIWVNSLWFSNLAISLTCALLATLLQQWTRRYIKVTQPLGSPHKRARIRQFFFSRVDNLNFLLAADAVPTLLHLSVFLFFAGLLILLRNISHTVFNSVVVWVVLCVGIYGYITFLPIFQSANPHYAPLASFAWEFWEFCTHMLYLISKALSCCRKGTHSMYALRPASLLRRLEKKAEEIVLQQSLELDAHILESLLNTMGEDCARERFFEAIPDFYSSRVQKEDFNKHLPPDFVNKFWLSVNQFLDETLSSDSVSELTRSRRLLTCLNSTHIVLGDRAGTNITDRIIRSRNWNEVPPSPEIGHILRRWCNSPDPWISIMGRCIIARIIGSTERHDDTWMALTISQLLVSERVLEEDLKCGDSVFLANLTGTTRLFFEQRLQFQDILLSISQFNVLDTHPELRFDFCTLWNEVVRRVQDTQGIGSSCDCDFILQEIGHVFNALHPRGPMAIFPNPSSSTATENMDSLHIGFFYSSCPDPQSHLLTTGTPQ